MWIVARGTGSVDRVHGVIGQRRRRFQVAPHIAACRFERETHLSAAFTIAEALAVTVAHDWCRGTKGRTVAPRHRASSFVFMTIEALR